MLLQHIAIGKGGGDYHYLPTKVFTLKKKNYDFYLEIVVDKNNKTLKYTDINRGRQNHYIFVCRAIQVFVHIINIFFFIHMYTKKNMFVQYCFIHFF